MASRPTSSFRQIFGQKDFRLPGLVMFGRYQYAASQSGLLSHSHRDAIEICFLERGEQSYRVRGSVYRLRGSDQFFTLPGELHDSADLPQERGILYWLILRLEPPKKLLGLSEALAARLKRELRLMPTRHFRAHPDCARLLAQVTGLLTEENPRGWPSAPVYRQLRLQSLLLQYLTLTIEASHRGARGSATPLMQRVLHYVEEHLTDPIQVSRLAEVARLSESRFKTRFKGEIGIPPAEFWLRKKMGRATVLLKTSSVTEVAFALGFSSSQYFATVFKRYLLTNPSHFQAANRRARGGNRTPDQGLMSPLLYR
jgi:AraC-like DNA-binding protein